MLVAGFAAFGVLAVSFSRASIADAHFERLTAVAAAAAGPISGTAAASRLERLSPESIRTRANFDETLRAIRGATGVRRVRIIRADFATLADSSASEPFAEAFDVRIDEAELQRVFQGEPARSSALVTNEQGLPILHGYAPIRSEAGPVVAIAVVDGEADILAPVVRLTTWLAAAGALGLALLVLVSLRASRSISQPITGMVELAEKIAAGNYAHDEIRPDARAATEIQRLRNALDDMCAALSQREEDQQMMVSGIAHEIRNPLAGLRLRVELLQDVLQRAGHQHDLELLQKDIEHLDQVVSAFLAWARRAAVSAVAVPLAPLLHQLTECNDAAAAGQGVRLAITGTDAVVLADADMLRSALQNLVQNAVQASPPGAAVTVSVLALDTDAQGAVEIRVQDEAGGMSASQLRDAMRPFFTTRQKGTGLGLPLTRRLVERMGGQFEIRSSVGEGTEVTIRLVRATGGAGDPLGPPQEVAFDPDAGDALIG